MDISLGQIVHSKAGRDKGRSLIIIDFVNDDYVMVADGNLRKLESPKKKKIKHLNYTNEINEVLRDKLKNKIKITNAEVRKILTVYELNQKTTLIGDTEKSLRRS